MHLVHHHPPWRCRLLLGAFLLFNSVASQWIPQGTSLEVPDVEVPIEVLGLSATVQASGIVCRPIQFGEFGVSFDSDTLELTLLEFDTPCELEYSYTSALASNSGSATITTRDNGLALSYRNRALEACESKIQVKSIEFATPEPLEGVFNELVENGIGGVSLDTVFGDAVCDYFRDDPRALDSLISEDEDFSIFDLVSEVAREDAISVERASTTNTTLVDFQESTSWPAIGVKLALDVLSTTSNDDYSYLDQLWNIFLDDQGLFRYEVGFEISSTANSTLLIKELQMAGASNAFRGIRAVGKHTVQLDIELYNITVGMSGTLRYNDTSVDISVDANVTTFSATVAIYLPVDQVALGEIPIAALMETDTAIPCLTTIVLEPAIADAEVRSLQFTPSSSPDWEIIQRAGIVLDLDILSSRETGTTRSTSTRCARPRYFNPDSAFLDFRDLFLPANEAMEYGTRGLAPYGKTFSTVKRLADETLLRLAKDSAGLSVDRPIVLADGTPTSEGSSFLFSLDSLKLDLTDQTPSYVLEPLRNMSATATNFMSVSSFDMEGVVGVGFGELSVDDEWEFRLLTESVEIYLHTVSYIFEQAFLDFPLRDVLEINCWLAAIPQGIENSDVMFAIEELSIESEVVDVDLRCVKCHKTAASSISFTVDPSMGLQTSINDFISIFQGQEADIQTLMKQLIWEAPLRCPHHPNFDSTLTTNNFALATPPTMPVSYVNLAVVGSLVALILCLVVLYHIIQPAMIRRRNRTGNLESEASDEANRRHLVQNDEHFAQRKGKRFLILAVIMLSNVLFILGTVEKSYLFRLYIDVAEKHFVTLDISYSATQLVRDFWVGGGKVFALLVIAFSLFIPLMRNMCLLLMQFAPMTTSSNVRQIQLILRCLNFLGKWVVGVFFVNVVAATALSPQVALPFTTIDGFVVLQARGLMPPVYGLIIWVIAQIISQLCGESILRDVKSTDSNSRQLYSKELAKTESSLENEPSPIVRRCENDCPSIRNSLSTQFYRMRGATTTETLFKVSKAANGLLVLTAALFLVLLGMGVTFPYLSFKQQGLLTPNGTSTTNFSMVSMLGAFASNAKYSESPSLMFYTVIISCLLVAFVVVLPAFEVSCLLLLWFRELSAAGIVRLNSFARWLRVFGYTEIFVLSAVVATTQISMIVEFLVGKNCEALAGVIAIGVDLTIIEPEEAFCYDVVGEVREASVFLLLAAFILICLRTFVDEAVSSSLSDEFDVVGVQTLDNEPDTERDARAATSTLTRHALSFPARFRFFFQQM